MVNNLLKIESLLSELIKELNSSGKKESANFFQKKLDDINAKKEDIVNIIESLSSCRAMSQYANFSYKEEKYLDDLIEYVYKYLKDG